MKRQIHGHETNAANATLHIHATDEPGAGGANHLYEVTGLNTDTNPSCPVKEAFGVGVRTFPLLFQNGPIPEAGVNGLTHEVLLTIVLDRLQQFQEGPYACAENAAAAANLTAALMWLNQRTANRLERGVEGTHEV